MGLQVREWQGRTGGGDFGQTFLLNLLKRIRVVNLYPLLYFIIPFYMLFARRGYHAIYSYFHLRLGKSKWQSFLSTFKNHIVFGQIVLDKFALLSNDSTMGSSQFKISAIEGLETFNDLIKSDKGFIIAGSHIGNFELIGHCLTQDKKKINGIIFEGEALALQKQRVLSLAKSHINLIEVGNDISHIFAIKEALEKGEIITIPCDRINGSSKVYSCDFLNAKANFPIGTFKLALTLQCPLIAMFVMKETKTEYKAYIIKLEAQTVEQCIEQYCKAIEKILNKYPLQWFNYYDFWK
jgi:predicted LPLAT superfamily acyltransferase